MKIGKCILLLIIACGMICFTANCKKTPEAGKVMLTVRCAMSVDGEPKSGDYEYDQNATVPYNYTPVTGYENVQVMLDGQPVAASGTVTMDVNHTITNQADRIMYGEGNWLFDISWNWVPGDQNCHPDNVTNGPAVGTQEGDTITFIVSGVAPEDIVLTGTIDTEGNTEVKAEIWYSFLIAKYTFTGKLDPNVTPYVLTGTCLQEGFLQSDPTNAICTCTGTFTGRQVD